MSISLFSMSYIPWDKLNFIMVYELSNVLLNCLLKFFWGFLHLCSSVILACSFLFLSCLCLVLVSGWWWPHRMSLEAFPPLQFFESFRRIGISSSWNVWQNALVKPSRPGLFLGGRLLITASIPVLIIGLFIISIFYWFSLGRLNFSRICPFLPSYPFYCHIIVHNSLL